MSKILIIGAGAMGSAFSFPCVDNGHQVNIVGSPLEDKFINELSKKNFHHALNCNLEKNINFLKVDKLQEQLKNKPDLIIVTWSHWNRSEIHYGEKVYQMQPKSKSFPSKLIRQHYNNMDMNQQHQDWVDKVWIVDQLLKNKISHFQWNKSLQAKL